MGDEVYARTFDRMKSACAVSLSCIVAPMGCQIPSSLQGKYQTITKEDGIVIGFGYESSWNSTTYPLEKPIEEIDSSDRASFILNTKLALARYPQNFWEASDVYILGIDFDGKGRVSAFHSMVGIYVDIGSGVYEGTIHHELGHRLSALHASAEFKQRWSRLNQSSYIGLDRFYKERESHKDRKPSSYDWSLLNQGFVSRYSQANFDEDFSEVFEMLLMGSRSHLLF